MYKSEPVQLDHLIKQFQHILLADNILIWERILLEKLLTNAPKKNSK